MVLEGTWFTEVDELQCGVVKLRNLLNVQKLCYKVPCYQREYVWEVQEQGRDGRVLQFLEDLFAAFRAKHDKQHFVLLGNAVFLRATKNAGVCDIIDGQQRLTTLVMLYAAIHHELMELRVVDELDLELERMRDRFLMEDEIKTGNELIPLLTLQQRQDEHFNGRVIKSFQAEGLTALFNHKNDRRHIDNVAIAIHKKLRTQLDKWQSQPPPPPQQQQQEGGQKKVAEGEQEQHLQKKAAERWELLEQLLDYFDNHVALTVTMTSDPELAFQTFVSANHKGQPLTEVNMLKALLVSRQDSKTKAGKKLIKQLTDDWMQVESSLAALLAAMEEKVDKSGKNSMAARANTAPYNNTLAHDIASQHLPYGVEPTMFDELLEHIRTIHDPHQSCRPSSSIAFFTKKLKMASHEGLGDEGLDISAAPRDFVENWLKPCSEAMAVMLLPYATNENNSLNEEAKLALYHMLCLPHDEWRPVVMYAIKEVLKRLIQLNEADEMKPKEANEATEKVQSTLVSFLYELHHAAVYLGLRRKQGGAVFFDAKARRKVYGDVLLVLRSSTAPAEQVLEAAKDSIWQVHLQMANRAHVLKSLLRQRLPVFSINRHMAISLLMLADLPKGYTHETGVRSWYGSIQVEHVLPQNPVKEWFVGGGGPFTEEEHKRLVHTLGNLMLIKPKLNFHLSNLSWQEKKEKLQGCVSSTTTWLLEKEAWTPAEIQRRLVHIVQRLAKSWDLEAVVASLMGDAPAKEAADAAPVKKKYKGTFYLSAGQKSDAKEWVCQKSKSNRFTDKNQYAVALVQGTYHTKVVVKFNDADELKHEVEEAARASGLPVDQKQENQKEWFNLEKHWAEAITGKSKKKARKNKK